MGTSQVALSGKGIIKKYETEGGLEDGERGNGCCFKGSFMICQNCHRRTRKGEILVRIDGKWVCHDCSLELNPPKKETMASRKQFPKESK